MSNFVEGGDLVSFGEQMRRRREELGLTRQQLADYLNVERSALSNELSLMQRDGLIRYEKNHFAVTEETEKCRNNHRR